MRQTHRREHSLSLATLDHAVFAYLESEGTRHEWSPGTVPVYRGILLQFSSAYGRRPWDQLNATFVEGWKKSLKEEGYLESVRHDKQSVVRGFLRWLATSCPYYVEVNGRRAKRHVPDLTGVLVVPRRKVGGDPKGNQAKYLKPHEVAAILAEASGRQSARPHAIISLMLYPGLRRVELHRMRLGDYDGVEMHVRGKGGNPTMRDGRWEYPVTRTIPVGSQCHAALERWLAERGRRPGPMFPGRPADVGLSVVQIGTTVRDVMEAAGVKTESGDGKSCHALRHTCISDALNVQKQPLQNVQRLAGHANPHTTGRYHHLDSSELLACVERPQYRALRKPAAEPAPEGKPRVRRQSFRRAPATAA